MTHIRNPRTPLNRIALSVTALVTLVAAVIAMSVSATTAQADSIYHLRGCSQAAGSAPAIGAGSMTGWWTTNSALGGVDWNCGGPSPGLGVPSGMSIHNTGGNGGNTATGAYGMVYVEAPASRNVDLWSTHFGLYLNLSPNYAARHASCLNGHASCTNGPLAGAGVGPSDVTNPAWDYNNNGAKHWAFEIVCIRAGNCSTGSGAVQAIIHDLTMAVRDTDLPSLSSDGGTLLDNSNGGWKTSYGIDDAASGNYTVTAAWSDNGGGMEGTNLYEPTRRNEAGDEIGGWKTHNYGSCAWAVAEGTAQYSSVTPCPTTKSDSRTTSVAGLPDGSHEYLLGGRDAGQASRNETRNVKVDSTPPATATGVEATTPGVGEAWSNDPSRTFRFNQPGTGAGSPNATVYRALERNTNGDSWTQVGSGTHPISGSGAQNIAQPSLSGLPSGVYRNRVTIQDQAGNMATGNRSSGAVHRYDVAAPSVDLTGYNGAAIDGKQVVAAQAQIELSGHDQAGLSGVRTLEYQVDNAVGTASWQNTAVQPAGQAEEFNGTVDAADTISIPGDGLHRVRVRSLDNAGNRSAEKTISFTLTAPTRPGIDVTNPGVDGNPTVGSTLTCHGGDVSPGSVVTYQWLRDANPIQGATNPAYTVVEADRGHTLFCKVRIVNEAGITDTLSDGIQIPGVNNTSGSGEEPCRPNGTNADPEAKLVTAFNELPTNVRKPKKSKRKLSAKARRAAAKKKKATKPRSTTVAQRRFGQTAKIVGKLTNRSGKAISKAQLELHARYRGVKMDPVEYTGITTKADGTFTYQMDTKLPSANLELVYKPQIGVNCAAAIAGRAVKAGLSTTATAGSRLSSSKKSVRRGHAVRFKVKLSDTRNVPPRGVHVKLFALIRNPGSKRLRWVAGDSKQTTSKGVATFTQRLGGPKVWRLRAEVHATPEYPYLRGWSNTIRLRVR